MKYLGIALVMLTLGCDGSRYLNLPEQPTAQQGDRMDSLTAEIMRGHYHEVSNLLAAGADPNRPDRRGVQLECKRQVMDLWKICH